MAEIGQTSTAVEEVIFTDIHMDTVQPRVAAPIEEPESDPEEGDREDAVWGGVMGQYSEEEAGTDDDEEDEEPAEYIDGMGTVASDIIDTLTTANEELEERVQHLEEQNQIHQQTEDQYRDTAYMFSGENIELKARMAEMEVRLIAAELKIQQTEAEREAMRGQMQQAVEDRLDMEIQRDAAHGQMMELEEEVREKKVRIDRLSYVYRSSVGRIQRRVHYYPAEEGQTLHTISRDVVRAIGDEEYYDAVRRGMRR